MILSDLGDPFLFLITLIIPSSLADNDEPLQCYHCINRLSTKDISHQEQNMMKSVLFNRFNIPPSSEYCAEGGDDILFRAIDKEFCPLENDTCVRIVAAGDPTKKLVLRGCQSTLFKGDYDLDTNYSCGKWDEKAATSEECITTCRTDLCNISHGTRVFLTGIIMGLVGIWNGN